MGGGVGGIEDDERNEISRLRGTVLDIIERFFPVVRSLSGEAASEGQRVRKWGSLSAT